LQESLDLKKNRFDFFAGFSWYSYCLTRLRNEIQQQAKKSTAEYSCYWQDHLKGTRVLGIFQHGIKEKREIGSDNLRERADAMPSDFKIKC
jgi:hypothetical protein